MPQISSYALNPKPKPELQKCYMLQSIKTYMKKYVSSSVFFTYFIQTKLSSEVLLFFSSYAVNRKPIMTPFLSYLWQEQLLLTRMLGMRVFCACL